MQSTLPLLEASNKGVHPSWSYSSFTLSSVMTSFASPPSSNNALNSDGSSTRTTSKIGCTSFFNFWSLFLRNLSFGSQSIPKSSTGSFSFSSSEDPPSSLVSSSLPLESESELFFFFFFFFISFFFGGGGSFHAKLFFSPGFSTPKPFILVSSEASPCTGSTSYPPPDFMAPIAVRNFPSLSIVFGCV